MAKRPNKKPTVRELANALIEVNNRVNDVRQYCTQLDKIVGLILQMNNQTKEFNDYLDKLGKENDKKANATTDKKDIPADTGDKGGRAKGVRKKKR